MGAVLIPYGEPRDGGTELSFSESRICVPKQLESPRVFFTSIEAIEGSLEQGVFGPSERKQRHR